ADQPADPHVLGGTRRPRRRAGESAPARPHQGAAGDLALLRRHDHRAGRGSTEHLTGDRTPILDLRPGLAVSAAEQCRSARITRSRFLSRGWSAPADYVALNGEEASPPGESAMNADEVLQAVLEKRNPAERAAYLDGACGQDAKLRALVEGLLRAHEVAG